MPGKLPGLSYRTWDALVAHPEAFQGGAIRPAATVIGERVALARRAIAASKYFCPTGILNLFRYVPGSEVPGSPATLFFKDALSVFIEDAAWLLKRAARGEQIAEWPDIERYPWHTLAEDVQAAERDKAAFDAMKAEADARQRVKDAADDLLAAAKLALEAIELHIPPTEFAPRDALRAAIAKAEGRG